MVKQTVWERIDPKTGQPSYRPDILEMQLNKPINVCPSTEGGKNWQGMSYNQPTGVIIAPLSQSCMDFTARQVDFNGNAGGSGGDCTGYQDSAVRTSALHLCASLEPRTQNREPRTQNPERRSFSS